MINKKINCLYLTSQEYSEKIKNCLWLSCFDKKTEREKAAMRGEKKGKIKLRRDNELEGSEHE